jgi:hypothetical protein
MRTASATGLAYQMIPPPRSAKSAPPSTLARDIEAETSPSWPTGADSRTTGTCTATGAEGRAMTTLQAFAAREHASPPLLARAKRKLIITGGQSVHPTGLSVREIAVPRLVAEGLTDAEVAERLVLMPSSCEHTSGFNVQQAAQRFPLGNDAPRYRIPPRLSYHYAILRTSMGMLLPDHRATLRNS